MYEVRRKMKTMVGASILLENEEETKRIADLGFLPVALEKRDYYNPFAPLSNSSISKPPFLSPTAPSTSVPPDKAPFHPPLDTNLSHLSSPSYPSIDPTLDESYPVVGINDSAKHRPFAQWLSSHQPFIGALLETHIKEPNLNQLLSTLCPGWRYISNHNTDEDGRIIIIWKDSVSVQEIHQTRQSLTCKITLQTGQHFFFSAIYASNIREERLDLWSGLVEVQQTYYLEDQSWLIGGDLNQIIHHAEHSSPTVNHLTADMVELRDFLNSPDL
ncbi:hypothetical protein F2Q70_00038469 [Brassica cretica]|uniref:Endonuclease/exonuclease/phosphatase domain-containing protein n=1 Tax=Brassica cretica TaxID=69181 RepID=A0A8S9K613_BRACR|nr:hypothetical protein F2Q70_00038469 [Brassica cretica]